MKRAAKRRVSSFTAKKRRNRDMYDVNLLKRFRTEKELGEVIESVKIKIPELPDDQVKITFVAKHRKKKASMSFIYNLDESGQKENADNIKYSMLDMLTDIFKKKEARDKTKSWQRIQPIKNYIYKMIIDFETND